MAYQQIPRLLCAALTVCALSAACKNPYENPPPVDPARPDASVDFGNDLKQPPPEPATDAAGGDEPGPDQALPEPNADAALAPEAAPVDLNVVTEPDPVPPCLAGAACGEAQPCTKGVTVCRDGASLCEQAPLPDKTSCAHEGQAGECQAGLCTNPRCNTPCEKPEAPCTVHRWSCGSNQWAPTCAPTIDSVPAGTSCGPGMVCIDSVCRMRTCIPDTACGDAKCGPGKIRCLSEVSAECLYDPALRKPDGERCEAGKICRNGSCVDCPGEGTDCREGCRVGKVSCLFNATTNPRGERQCAITGNVPTGQPCDPAESGKFCRDGACVACENQGMTCAMGACKNASMRCLGGQPATCVFDGNKPDGESCGSALLCRGGECVGACPRLGQSCPTGNPCMPGTWACQDNREICNGRMVDNGTPCGDNQICRDGRCGDACPRAGMPCTPTDRCQEGRYACQNGVEACVNAGPKPAGTPCPQGVCTATGACACPATASCGPAMNVCRERRRTGCMEGGMPICSEDIYRLDRTPCGPSRACQGGDCRDCNSANYCGVTCERCRTTVADADPTCVAGACGWRCKPNFWNCDGRCLPDNQVTRCTTPDCASANGNGVACTNATGGTGWACAPKWHRCNALDASAKNTGPPGCYEETNAAYCGAACTKCMWNQTCNGTMCVSTGTQPPG